MPAHEYATPDEDEKPFKIKYLDHLVAHSMHIHEYARNLHTYAARTRSPGGLVPEIHLISRQPPRGPKSPPGDEKSYSDSCVLRNMQLQPKMKFSNVQLPA